MRLSVGSDARRPGLKAAFAPSQHHVSACGPGGMDAPPGSMEMSDVCLVIAGAPGRIRTWHTV